MKKVEMKIIFKIFLIEFFGSQGAIRVGMQSCIIKANVKFAKRESKN